jgi:hypothetical protein
VAPVTRARRGRARPRLGGATRPPLDDGLDRPIRWTLSAGPPAIGPPLRSNRGVWNFRWNIENFKL